MGRDKGGQGGREEEKRKGEIEKNMKRCEEGK